MLSKWIAKLEGSGSAKARIAAAEARAAAAERRLQSALDALPEGIVLLDGEGRYVLWNRRYAEIYHRSADLFLVGRRMMDALKIGVERGDYPDAKGREAQWLAERERRLKNPGPRHEQQIADGTWLMIEERRTPDGGVVGLRVDITEMKRQALEIERGSARRDEVMERLGEGLSRLAAGDLACSIAEAFPDEYERLRADFNAAVTSLAQTCGDLDELSARVMDSAGAISDGARQLSRRTETQAATLEETAAALDQLTSAVLRNAEGAGRARDVAGDAFELSSKSNEIIDGSVAAMAEIQDLAHQVEGITEVIAEIALQTKLLALNTSIEAAHAGAAGKGFAIIAAEVRSLAEKSAKAAGDIKDLVTASAVRVDQGATLVNGAGAAFRSIRVKVSEIHRLIIDIASSAEEQAANLTQVNRAVLDMDRMTQQNAAMVDETSIATQDLTLEATRLREQMARFSVEEADLALRQAG